MTTALFLKNHGLRTLTVFAQLSAAEYDERQATPNLFRSSCRPIPAGDFMTRWIIGLAAAATAMTPALGADGASADRGREAVRGRPALNPAVCSNETYDALWKRWGAAERPADYAAAVRDRYGLHVAPYENGGLPMGLHAASSLFGKGVGTDCLLCHAGTVAGQTIVGLGNSTMDLEGLFDDLLANGPRRPPSFRFSYVRGTIDPVSPAAFLMSLRDADLNHGPPVPLDLFTDLCSDPPAWWLLKKKRTRDWTGAVDARTTRLDMITLLSPFNSGGFVRRQEPVFADIHAFVTGVEPPKYPFPMDVRRADRGRELFADRCVRCHGTYGPNGTYPNKIVPLDKIGTDPRLAESFSERNVGHINTSWLARETGPDGRPFVVSDTRGYQAPPLDGVWATAPYFHNGSAPTVYHVLNSAARPKVFTRSYRTGAEEYDPVRLGWKVTVPEAPPADTPGFERRKVYDTTLPGRGNGGHTYGDDLSDDDRLAVIEYLKTL
jgi:RoxA-like, cytochrome c-like